MSTQTLSKKSAAAPRVRSGPTFGKKVVKSLPAAITIIVLLAVTAYPLAWLFLNSLKSNQDFMNSPSWALPDVWQWSNYADAWTTGNLSTTFKNSLLVTIPSLLVIILIGTAAGFALEVMVFKGRGGILLMFLAGIMIPGQMIILPLYNVFYTIGISGGHLPLILVYIAGGMPLTVFIMATYFRALPREMFEAATIDGASMLRQFFTIGIPMMRNGILTVAIIQFFLIWNDLLMALIFAGKRNLNTIQVGLLNFQGEFGAVNYGPLFAAVCITNVGILVLYLFLNQKIMNGLAAGAVKG